MKLLTATDAYIARLVFFPLVGTLILAAMLLVLDKMLRLFDFVAAEGGPVSVVWRMLANLLPEYLSLGIPIGLLLGILISWSAPNNQTILSDVVSNEAFGTAIALEFAFEGTSSAFAMITVGQLAENVFKIENIGCFPYERVAQKVSRGEGEGRRGRSSLFVSLFSFFLSFF